MNGTIDGQPLEKPKFSLLRRLEFIDFRLLWSGRFNRQDLCDTFQISPQQASADIAAYQTRAPQNLLYDGAVKSYMRADSYKPLYMEDLTDRYLLQLVGIRSKSIRKKDTYFDSLPPSEVVTLPRRRTRWKHLQFVLDAIRDGLEIKIEYSSINTPGDTSRWIAPHAMAYSAGRWHVRAWSRERNDFRDFNLNRITAVFEKKPVKIDAKLDYEWNITADLILVANSRLNPETKQAVEEEYGMIDGQMVSNTRLSLIFYLLNEYNLDLPYDVLNPNRQQLVLLNLEEILAEQRLARKMTAEALKKLDTAW